MNNREHEVVAVKHDSDGTICQYQLNSGEVLSVDECVKAIHDGKITELQTFETRDGSTGIHSKRGIANYKLEDLPEIK